MTSQVQIEQVSKKDRSETVCFLVSGGQCDASTLARSQGLLESLSGENRAPWTLWRARRGNDIVAATLLMEHVGKVGMLFFCPANAPKVDSVALVQLLHATGECGLRKGMSLVQALVAVGADANRQVLASAGFELLAELVYMRCDLNTVPEQHEPSQIDLSWCNYAQVSEEELADLIGRTYVNSLDCRGLRGVRDPRDVLAGHKCSGVFCPEAWWIVKHQDHPVGCILVNDLGRLPQAEVIYLGVVEEFRGKGIGRALLTRAMRQAYQRKCRWISLAVDSVNAFAKELYESTGFRELRRQFAYVFVNK